MAEGRPDTLHDTQTHWQVDSAGVALNAHSGWYVCVRNRKIWLFRSS